MIKIRPETIADYAAIARVNARAFNTHPGVAWLISLHRHRTRFDPELSLVAEDNGRIVGHVLFSPQTIRLLGRDVEVVNLSPLAVDPDYQRQGIGAMLVREGHATSKAKGYPLSFLVGHPSYYPRLGYLQRAYGGTYDGLSMRVVTAGFAAGNLETHAPGEADIPALRELWHHEEGSVDFSIDPGDALLGWLSPNLAIKSFVYTRAGEIVGYARVSGSQARYFLARDGETARQMAKQMGAEVELPLHPNSASANSLGTPAFDTSDAAMACPLAPSPFDEYYAQVQAGTHLAGRSIWGVEFDIS